MVKRIFFKKVLLCLGLCIISTFSVRGQVISVDDTSYTTQQLIEDILIDSPCAQVSNFLSYTGTAQGFNGIGYFEANGSGFEIDKGVILSTGNAKSAVGPNGLSSLSDGEAVRNEWGGDLDLSNITATSFLHNASYIQFDFVPTIDFISFDFLFASEEYKGNFPCTHSDVFAFILTDSSGVSRNLAVVPGTNPPVPIKVTTVNNGGTNCLPQHVEYYNKTIPPGANSPINFNGYTKVLTASGAVVPNEKYTIKLVIADNKDGSLDSAVFLEAGSFNLGVDLGNDLTISAGNAGCNGTPIVLDATMGVGSTYTWQKDGSPLVTSDGTTLLDGGAKLEVTKDGIYSIAVAVPSGCSTTDSVVVEFLTPTIVSEPVNNVICDIDGDAISVFDLTSNTDVVLGSQDPSTYVVTYHLTEIDAENYTGLATDKKIDNPNNFTNTLSIQTIWLRVADVKQKCYKTASFEIEAVVNVDFNTPSPFKTCEINFDGIGAFSFDAIISEILFLNDSDSSNDLNPDDFKILFYESNKDALLGNANSINSSDTYNNTIPYNQTIYVNLSSGKNTNDCSRVVPVELIVNKLANIALEDNYTICLDKDDIRINLLPIDEINIGLNSTDYTFQWYKGIDSSLANEISGQTEPTFLPDASGDYTVQVIDKVSGCVTNKTTSVIGSYPPESIIAEILSGAFSESVSIKVTVVGNGEYEYKINDGDWQKSNIFTKVYGGEYIAYVRDLRLCGESEFNVGQVVEYPKYFTPNGDGFHDTWTIKGSDTVIISGIKIFNRHEKLLKDLGAGGSWDGTYNGEQMPSTDYWFKVSYTENNINKEFKANFSLIR